VKGVEAGSCNGCQGRPEELWVISLKGLLVRLCDDCFEELENQRQWYKQKKWEKK
jgi:hypothetical protein